jgi:hypothetical protein
MRFRRANAVLLLLLVAAMVSGLLGLANGSQDLAIFILADPTIDSAAVPGSPDVLTGRSGP